MRPSARSSQVFLLGTYLVLSAIPFLPYLFGRPVTNAAELLGIEFVAWLTVWAIFGRPARFHWLLLPAFIALPIELYLYIYYGQGISTHHLGVIAETSPKETFEFLGYKVWLLTALMVFIVGWFVMSWRAALRTRELDWSDSSRWPILTLLLTGFLIWLYGHQVGVQAALPQQTASVTRVATHPAIAAPPAKHRVASGDDSSSWMKMDVSLASLPKLAGWATIPFDVEKFGRSWPFGLVMRGVEFWKERAYLRDLKFKSSNFSFGARQSTQADAPQVVVLIIGESSRFDRWSLNGYTRETNPLLKAEANLVSLSDVISGVSATRLAVPILVSRKPATQSLKAGFSEKSFLSAYKEAGYKTYWLSNQMSFGKFDTPVSVYANEAEITQFMNMGGFTNGSTYDDVLLDPLRRAIADPAQKKLIVLHTLGNHWNYSHRYPQQYDKWQPSLFGIVNPAYTDLKLKQEINNSYDNSILYTDWFLAQVIGSLKSSAQLTSMMYVSDHGQSLYDGNCKLAFHGHNTEYDFHIPALVWYSDQYKTAYPAKVAELLRNKDAKLSTENVFHSLLDMADIRYPTEKLEWSFLNPTFRRHKRYVDSYGWTDYDNSTFKGDCREVIDKGKPLMREK